MPKKPMMTTEWIELEDEEMAREMLRLYRKHFSGTGRLFELCHCAGEWSYRLTKKPVDKP